MESALQQLRLRSIDTPAAPLPLPAQVVPLWAPALLPAAEAEAPVQRVIKVRRDYNSRVAGETMEDYALCFTPQRFRKWSEWRVANTAFGAASFLILEAVGATLLVQYGFTNAFWAIVDQPWGCLICALVVPLVTYGVAVIGRWQMWTQPCRLLMLVVPFVCVLVRDPAATTRITHYKVKKAPIPVLICTFLVLL